MDWLTFENSAKTQKHVCVSFLCEKETEILCVYISICKNMKRTVHYGILVFLLLTYIKEQISLIIQSNSHTNVFSCSMGMGPISTQEAESSFSQKKIMKKIFTLIVQNGKGS